MRWVDYWHFPRENNAVRVLGVLQRGSLILNRQEGRATRSNGQAGSPPRSSRRTLPDPARAALAGRLGYWHLQREIDTVGLTPPRRLSGFALNQLLIFGRNCVFIFGRTIQAFWHGLMHQER